MTTGGLRAGFSNVLWAFTADADNGTFLPQSQFSVDRH